MASGDPLPCSEVRGLTEMQRWHLQSTAYIPLSLCVNLASCVQLWDGQNSSAPCILTAAPPRQSRNVCWLLQNCWDQWEASRLVSHLFPCHWLCSQSRLRGTVCNLAPRTCALHASSHVCSAIPLVHPWLTPNCSGLEDRSFAENFWFLCASTALFTFIRGSYTWIQMCFCSYIQQQDL